MALGEVLVDLEGRSHPMAGVLPGRFRMTERLRSFGYKRLRTLHGTLMASAGDEGKGHEFHHSVREDAPQRPAWTASPLRGEGTEEGQAEGNLLASYAHLHFGAQPAWAQAWVARMRAWRSGAEEGRGPVLT